MSDAQVHHVCQSQNHMATTFVFRVSCEARKIPAVSRLLREAHALVGQLEKNLSEYLPESPVFLLNQAPPLVRVRMTREGMELLERSEKLRLLTDGSFNCAAKSLNNVANVASVAWDTSALEAWRIHEGARIGFGAIGKGYALDQVRVLLEQQGLHDFVLSAGGSSIILSGFAAPGEPWNWGWSWKKSEAGNALGMALTHPSGQAIAIGVSGTHEKGRHLIDPRGQLYEMSAPQSTLVALASAADADALSTALFVSGYDQGARYLSRLPADAAMAQIDSATFPSWNGIFQKLWGSLAIQAAPVLIIASLALTAPFAARADAPVAEISPVPALSEAPTVAPIADDGSVDLGGLGINSFTPYLNERNPWWALLPLSAAALVLIHLRKVRRISVKKPTLSILAATASVWALLEQAHAVEIEPMGKALVAVLGTPKAFTKKVGDVSYYYSKDSAGKAERIAMVRKNVWQKSCSHTWVVGLDKHGKITEVRAQEMQCPHAFPAKSASFLDQYKGKSLADLDKLSGEVSTIAKATGSCELATDAVKESITAFQKIKGQL